MVSPPERVDIVMLGTFAAWRLGTLQARALPFAKALARHGIRCAIVTTPWDMPSERGVTDILQGVPLFNTAHVSPQQAPLAVHEQLGLVHRLQPAAVHVFKPKGFGGITGHLLRSKLPVLVDSDDWEGDGGWNQAGSYGRLQRRVFEWQEQSMLRTAHGVTAASTLLYQRAKALRARCGERQTTLLPNGLGREWFTQLSSARSIAMRPDAGPADVLLYSRFAEFGSDWLPRFAAALEHDVDSPTRIVAVGLAGTSYRVSDNVIVDPRGFIERTALPAVLGSARIAIFPYDASLVTRSKQSVKLLELMAAGCIVVASDVGDVASVLNGTGVLVPRADPVEFARVTARILRRDAELTTLRTLAASRVHRHYLMEAALVDQLTAWYRDMGVVRR